MAQIWWEEEYVRFEVERAMDFLFEQHIGIKQRQRGYDEATFIKSFMILNAVVGNAWRDFEQLRADAALAELIGPGMPSPDAARNFLCEFHEDAKIVEAQLRLKPTEVAYIPKETIPLQGLGAVNRHLIGEVGLRSFGKRYVSLRCLGRSLRT